MSPLPLFLIFFVSLLCLTCPVACDDHTHTYAPGEEVVLWYNRVGPYHNPQETYAFSSLPLCKEGNSSRTKDHSLGVVLEGEQLVDSGMVVRFGENKHNVAACSLQLSNDGAATLLHAVKQHYWYQMYVDELPAWGMLGEYMMAEVKQPNGGESLLQEQGFLYTHKDFAITYNGARIIEVNLTSDAPRPITPGTTLQLTYSVTWLPTTKPFESRFDRYLDFDFFEHQIHWFSIFNSFMMVVFLLGLVSLILMRTLKNDYARYAEGDDLDIERVSDDSGWKQVHGDVFRAPAYSIVYAALIGVGAQLAVLGLLIIVLTLFATLYDERGQGMTVLLACYSLTSFVSGWASSVFYKTHGGTDWKKCMLLTASLFPGFCFVLSFGLNFIAVYYGSMAAFSLSTITVLFALWLVVCVPLVTAGTIVGRGACTAGDFPCRVNSLRRPIPQHAWYTHPITLALLAGILPFGSIFIEMYFIFTSFWNYKFYYVYGFMFLVFIILILVTVCTTIVATYILLNSEDYRWHWTALCSGGSTALYVFLYAIYYFYTKTRMHGLMQTTFYFGYMIMLCVGLFVLTGTIGYFGANIFIRRIYQYIKSD